MNKRLPGLDLLRAAAIGLVLITHGGMFFVGAYHLRFVWINLGPLGVDLFFVLSGFLIGGIVLGIGDQLRSPRMVAGFWLNRALRTLPNYYLFLGLNLILWQSFLRYHIPVNRGSVLPFFVFLQSFAHRPGLFFSESWSLCVEEWFYLIFPLGLFAGLGLGGRFPRIYWIVAAGMMAASFDLRVHMPNPADWNNDVNRVTLYRFDAIACGLFAAGINRRWPDLWRELRMPLLGLGLGLMASCYIFEARNKLESSLFAIIFLPLCSPLGCALLLPWGSTCEGLGGGLVERAAEAVARWSYSLYLFNLNVSLLVSGFVVDRIGPWGGLAVFVLASLALSAGVYRAFERPILRWRNRIPICAETSMARRGGAAAICPVDKAAPSA